MNLLQDWKKLAAAQQVDSADVEKSFLDMAYSTIANKARPIMQAPYRLGFEVVYSSENHDRMVGIFAFRVPGAGLLYAPVFFVGGEIKGTDLLYKHQSKTFVPLTEEWVRFLLENTVDDSGVGVERRFTVSVPQLLNLHKIKAPTIGNVGKSASAEEAPDYKGAWAEIEKLASAQKQLQPVLRDFIVQDGGASSVEFLAQAMERDFKFANHVHGQIPADTFAPADLAVKKAEAVPTLVLHRGAFDPATVKCASEDYFRRGFWLEDMRKEAALTEVFDDTTSEFISPSDPGIYNVIMKGGLEKKLFCARQNPAELPLAKDFNVPVTSDSSDTYYKDNMGDRQRYVLIDLENGEIMYDARRVVGRPVEQLACGQERVERQESDYILKEMQAGNAYCLFDTGSKTLSKPFWVKSKKVVDGVTQYSLRGCHCWTDGELVHNPEATVTKLKEGLCGDNARFIKVSGEYDESGENNPACSSHPNFECSFAPGSQADVTLFLLGGGVKFASVIRRGDDYAVRFGDRNQTREMGKVAAICHLAKNVGIHADVATALVEKAEASGHAGFCFLPKSASAVQLQAEPQFDPQLDPQFSVLWDPQPRYTVGTDFMPEQLPPQRIGDAWDPANLRGVLETANPNQLAELSQQLGVPNIFEHGVVGELVKTYDAAAMIQKYLPKLEDALDCLGRILFLLYWKPEDFKKAYGADDLTNKENEILSNFQSLGDLLLDLLKQTRPNRSGSVATGN